MKTITKIAIAGAAVIALGATAGFVQADGGWRSGDCAFGGPGHFDRMGHGGFGHHGGQGARMLERFDTDGDGSLTQDEIDTVLAGLLTDFDTSGDQSLTLDEFEGLWIEHARERMVDHFQALDADGDGQVTAAELDRRFGDIVSRMDRNDDGQLNQDDRPRRGHWSDDDDDN